MDEAATVEVGPYVEFDAVSLRSAPRFYATAFQLNYSADEAVLTLGYEGEALPSENAELDGKNFAEAVVFMSPRKAEELAGAMLEMIDVWVKRDVLDDETLTRILPSRFHPQEKGA